MKRTIMIIMCSLLVLGAVWAQGGQESKMSSGPVTLKYAFWGNPKGMVVYTGRVKKKNGRIGFVLLVNNIVKGAAGGSIQNAEAFVERFGLR